MYWVPLVYYLKVTMDKIYRLFRLIHDQFQTYIRFRYLFIFCMSLYLQNGGPQCQEYSLVRMPTTLKFGITSSVDYIFIPHPSLI